MNVCVTWDGSDSLPTGIGFIREREGGARDSLESAVTTNCFGELPGTTQRILVLHGSSVVDSSEWFTPDTVDCCHGEAKTIAFEK